MAGAQCWRRPTGKSLAGSPCGWCCTRGRSRTTLWSRGAERPFQFFIRLLGDKLKKQADRLKKQDAFFSYQFGKKNPTSFWIRNLLAFLLGTSCAPASQDVCDATGLTASCATLSCPCLRGRVQSMSGLLSAGKEDWLSPSGSELNRLLF